MDDNNFKFYTCKRDRAFKEVFLNDKDTSLLKALLESILKIKINNIIIKNGELNNNNVNTRRKLVDALLYTDNDVINIEVNSCDENYVRPRNFSYISNSYSNYVLKSKKFNMNIRFIQINFSYDLKYDELCKLYKLKDVLNDSGEIFIDNFEIYEFNMDKYMDFWYNKDKEKIVQYKYLIMQNLEKEELNKFFKSVNDKVVSKYMDRLYEINQDPKFQSYMSAEEDDRMIINSLKEDYYNKGVNQGTTIGAKKKMEDDCKGLHENGVSIDIIAKSLSISEDEVREILSL